MLSGEMPGYLQFSILSIHVMRCSETNLEFGKKFSPSESESGLTSSLDSRRLTTVRNEIHPREFSFRQGNPILLQRYTL